MSLSESFHTYREGGHGPEIPENKALIEKRNEYIDTAIKSVLASKRDEVLKSTQRELESLIQDELRTKSGLNEQIPSTQKNSDDFEREFNSYDIGRRLLLHFGVDDIRDLSDAIRKLYHVS